MRAAAHRLLFPLIALLLASLLLYFDKLSSGGWCVALLIIGAGYYLPDILNSAQPAPKERQPPSEYFPREFEE